MKINLSPVNQVPKIGCKKQQPKQISFGAGDEFVKKIYKRSLDEIEKEIQQKYQSAISQLCDKKNALAQDVRTKVTEEMFGNCDVKNSYESLYLHRKSIDSVYSDDQPKQNLKKVIEKIDKEYYTRNCGIPNVCISNCVMVTSKDKEFAENFLEFTRNYTKATQVFPSSSMSDDDLFMFKGSFHRTCYETLKDTFGDDLASFQEALLDTLEKAEKRYKETGNPTILHVENLENLIDVTKNDSSDIACMKDFMSSACEDYHTLLTFTNTDTSKSDPGTLASHRIGYRCDLDELGITPSDINEYCLNDELKNAVEKSSKIYKEGSEEYISLTKQINDLQKQCQDELEEAEQAFLDKNLINRIIKKFKENKKTVIVVAAIVAALTAVGIILHKKGKSKKQILTALPQQPQKLEQIKTQQLQSNNMKNLMKPKSSDVFSAINSN